MRKEDFTTAKETSALNVPLGFFKAAAISIAFTLLLFAIFSLVIAYTPVSEEIIPALSILAMVLGVCICACISTRGVKSRGYLKGAFSGLVYVFIIYLLSALCGGGLYIDAYVLVLAAVGVFAGAIGGIIGINLAVGRRR